MFQGGQPPEFVVLNLDFKKQLPRAAKGENDMIYKVYYQESKVRNPKREDTQSLYIEADNDVIVRQLVEEHTPYNIEYVHELDTNHLAYEQEHANFFLTEF